MMPSGGELLHLRYTLPLHRLRDDSDRFRPAAMEADPLYRLMIVPVDRVDEPSEGGEFGLNVVAEFVAAEVVRAAAVVVNDHGQIAEPMTCRNVQRFPD